MVSSIKLFTLFLRSLDNNQGNEQTDCLENHKIFVNIECTTMQSQKKETTF